jgi:hypothetical protein
MAELIPAPGRQLKTWSTWIAVGATVLSTVYAVLPDLQDLIEPKLYASIMAILVVAIKVVSLIKQNIPVTPEQKEAMLDSAIATPVVITPEPAKPLEGEKK